MARNPMDNSAANAAWLLKQIFNRPVERLGDVTTQLLSQQAPEVSDPQLRQIVAAQVAQPVSPAPAASPACIAPGLSARDNTYLGNYYPVAAAGAAQYNVDPSFLLGNGYESGFGTSDIYKGTGDAFGLTNGTPDRSRQRHAASPQDDVNQLLHLYGRQIQGVGNNQQAYINALHGLYPGGGKMPGALDYNSTNSKFNDHISAGIGQMKRDLPVWLKYCGKPNP